MSWNVGVPVFAVGIFVGILLCHISTTQPVRGRYLTREPILSTELQRFKFHPTEINYDPLGPEFTEQPWWEQFQSRRTLYVAPYTGLANTLQAMGSAMTIADREKMNVKVVQAFCE